MIFVDTSAWYASVLPTDPDHAAAIGDLRSRPVRGQETRAQRGSNRQALWTTDYIVASVFTPKGFHNIAQGCREAATLG
jgi:predicted nucleic acid-binding protein